MESEQEKKPGGDGSVPLSEKSGTANKRGVSGGKPSDKELAEKGAWHAL